MILGIIIFTVGLVATYWAYKQWKYERVWFCDGVADDVQINEAIRYLNDGEDAYINGVFEIERPIELVGYNKKISGIPIPSAKVLIRGLRKKMKVEEK